MKNSLLGKRYAKALFEVAKEKNLLKDLKDDTNSLIELFEQNKSIIDFMKSHFVDQDKKQDVVNEIANNLKLSDIWLHLLNILLDNKRIIYFEVILLCLIKIIHDNNNEIEVKLFLANEQEETVIQDLKNKLENILKKTPIIKVTMDPSLLGGFKAVTKSLIIDGSVVHNLIKFSNIEKLI